MLAGQSTHLLEGYPTPSDIRDLTPTRQAARSQLQRATIRNITVQLWIDPETNRPLRSDLRIELTVQDESSVLQFSYRFTAYNPAIDITVPADVYDHTWKTGCPG